LIFSLKIGAAPRCSMLQTALTETAWGQYGQAVSNIQQSQSCWKHMGVLSQAISIFTQQ
jgi:hypothetical protein